MSPPEFAAPEAAVFVADQRRLGLTLRDPDVDDTLYIKVFIDYGVVAQQNSVAECTAVPSGEQIRVADCSAATLCSTITDTAQHLLEVMVADREFLDEGDPPFRALPPVAASSISGWLIVCSPAE